MTKTNHRWHKYKCIIYPVCLGCGLVHYVNALTDWCVVRGCDYDEDPAYKNIVKILGVPKK